MAKDKHGESQQLGQPKSEASERQFQTLVKRGPYAPGRVHVPSLVKRHTAEVLRDMISPEFMFWYYYYTAMGRDPRVLLAAIDPKTCEEREDGPPPGSPTVEEKPTIEAGQRAMDHLWQRRDGMPAQQIQLDQTINARVQAGLSVDVGALHATLTADKARALRELLEADTSEPIASGDKPALALLPGK